MIIAEGNTDRKGRTPDDYATRVRHERHRDLIRKVRAGHFAPLIEAARICGSTTATVPVEDFDLMLDIIGATESPHP